MVRRTRGSWNLPSIPEGFLYRLDLSQAATPRLLKKRPRHRWFWFPHSYSPELVEAILEHWELSRDSHLLDPFVGAGTTLLVAKERGMPATGVDISPLAVRVSRAKVADYDRKHLERLLSLIVEEASAKTFGEEGISLSEEEVPERMRRAFTISELAALYAIREVIFSLTSGAEQDFFLIALLATAKAYSRAVADGGWFRWVKREEASPKDIVMHFQKQVLGMLTEVNSTSINSDGLIDIYQGDARHLNKLLGSYDAVITSPPYPNRHDYSRVFHIELLLLGQDEPAIKRLRYVSIRSHVEAKAPCETCNDNTYRPPSRLSELLAQLPGEVDRRVPRMLEGYFQDLYSVFRSIYSVLTPGAKLAFVVGNVRHGGILFPVDEILIDVGEKAGYHWTGAWVIRLRGNSAQQMGRFGRVPARESVVFFTKR